MAKSSENTPFASSSAAFENQVVYDVKPLRVLAPLTPDVPELNYSDPSNNSSPRVYETPFGSFTANPSSKFQSFFEPNQQESDKNAAVFDATPISVRNAPTPVSPTKSTSKRRAKQKASTSEPKKEPFFESNQQESDKNTTVFEATPLNVINPPAPVSASKSTSKKRSKQKASTSEAKKKSAPKKPKIVFDPDNILQQCSSHDARESVERILMTYDALRRRTEQVDEANNDGKRAYMKVWPIMVENNLRVNQDKRIGAVPGVEIGDMYYFRFEMCLIGLHFQTMNGIDTLTAKFDDKEDTVASCIVSSGGYENEDDDTDTIIYSGQGGTKKDEKSGSNDQKLARGNLALERSLHRGNEVRVVRGAKDFMSQTGKIYVYDGLYKVHESWTEKNKEGFSVFKFKLIREPGQRSGIEVWKRTQKWLEYPSSRDDVLISDLSDGIECLPVCLVNEVDSEEKPNFTYVTKVSVDLKKPAYGCTCKTVCLPGDVNCSCAHKNDGFLPYNASGLLVSQKPMIYECSTTCPCKINCRNRVTQDGVKLRFEVFRTNDRGWGLRCWHPIRAGTFICAYTGEVMDKSEAYKDDDENEYIFHGLVGDNSFKWNYTPELLGEESKADASETPEDMGFVIDAKNKGNIARFINHSCSPNLFWQPVMHDHGDDRYPHIMFFAIKNIPPMTELTYDYCLSNGKGGVSWKGKKCLCGSSKCRGHFC